MSSGREFPFVSFLSVFVNLTNLATRGLDSKSKTPIFTLKLLKFTVAIKLDGIFLLFAPQFCICRLKVIQSLYHSV